MPSRSAARGPTVPWDEATAAPLVLVAGPESLLAERAIDRLVQQARGSGREVTRIDAAVYEPGLLRVATGPSLFGDAGLVVLTDLQVGTDAALADVAEYVADPEPGAELVVHHGGGQRGRAVLDTLRSAAQVQVACDAVKRDADKSAFVADELRRAGRRADPAAVRALVEACGADLRELAAACQQLAEDTTGTISAEVVARYHGGRVEATGFRVADAAVEGRAGEAVALMRHAIATGSDPVPLVAALAIKLRTLAKVGAARGRGIDPVRDLGLAAWQVDRARRELRRWTPESLAAAINAVADADAQVKGGGRDPVFAVERAVLRVAAAAADSPVPG